MPLVDQGLHVVIEEGQQKCLNMGAIGISIGHDDDLAIMAFFDIEILPLRRRRSSG
jgi:hypothetical protein